MIKFIKADLDTVAAAALILNEQPENIYVLMNNAEEKSLNHSSCLCLECGGDGLCSLNNFDHHEKSELPCAAVQAFNEYKCSEKYRNLVNYVEYIDTGREAALLPYLWMTHAAVFLVFSVVCFHCTKAR